ncbi:MAG: DUF4416 family protein [Candidatus Omnitrophica bacterium]|nr:DUF4416 family protein [Candidatus Omnitrophota bacterium]
MSRIRRRIFRVKLIIGFIYKDEAVFVKASRRLKESFGRMDFLSEEMAFDCTDYYEKEMGKSLKRRFASFSRLIPIQDLSRIKLYTNRLEKRFSDGKSRRINIDPGYLDAAKVVLATTKDYAHRIFVGKGIFAEITLSFKGNSFLPNEWAYPDYRRKEYIDIFNRIRVSYIP